MIALYIVVKCLVMLQVSRVVLDLLGDVCQPFYYGPLGLDPNSSTRRSIKVSEQHLSKPFTSSSHLPSGEDTATTFLKRLCFRPPYTVTENKGKLLAQIKTDYVVSSKRESLCWDLIPSMVTLLSYLQQVNKMLLGECVYRNQRCLSPWAALFIWAVLQNRHEMAVFFWEMVRSTCNILLPHCRYFSFDLKCIEMGCVQMTLFVYTLNLTSFRPPQ